jgi:glycosyltransferase involved in cell wall biosynthesis
MEIVEAMSYGRPVVCSDGAGAAVCVKEDTGKVVPKRNVNA